VGDNAAPSLGKNDCELGGTQATGAPTAAEGKIAFASSRTGNREIWVMNADGSDPVQLTDNEVDDHAPTWSPDGAQIAYVSVEGNNGQIHIMNADGSGDIRIAEALKSASEPA
jgi:Tol biopolymer transport system component